MLSGRRRYRQTGRDGGEADPEPFEHDLPRVRPLDQAMHAADSRR